jgi:hypothetical protein
MPHWFALQTAEPLPGAGHAWPQLPQFDALVVRSTQLPEHGVSPPPQLEAQPPAEHDSAVAHRLSHLPQFAGSTDVSTQASPHAARPVSHTKPQTFASHEAVPNAGTLHAVSQLPQ